MIDVCSLELLLSGNQLQRAGVSHGWGFAGHGNYSLVREQALSWLFFQGFAWQLLVASSIELGASNLECQSFLAAEALGIDISWLWGTLMRAGALCLPLRSPASLPWIVRNFFSFACHYWLRLDQFEFEFWLNFVSPIGLGGNCYGLLTHLLFDYFALVLIISKAHFPLLIQTNQHYGVLGFWGFGILGFRDLGI